MTLRRNDSVGPYFSISQTPVEPKCCEHYSFYKKKTKALCDATSYQESCGPFSSPQTKDSALSRRGQSCNDKAEMKQFPNKGRLSASVAQLHFVSVFSSFPPLISSWLMLELFILSDHISLVKMISLTLSNHQVAVLHLALA